jgi:hypothetical protein
MDEGAAPRQLVDAGVLAVKGSRREAAEVGHVGGRLVRWSLVGEELVDQQNRVVGARDGRLGLRSGERRQELVTHETHAVIADLVVAGVALEQLPETLWSGSRRARLEFVPGGLRVLVDSRSKGLARLGLNTDRDATSVRQVAVDHGVVIARTAILVEVRLGLHDDAVEDQLGELRQPAKRSNEFDLA